MVKTMRGLGAILGVAVMGLAALTTPALAQSASDFRLPEASPTAANPRTQGPVDPDNPIVVTRHNQPSPTPSIAPVVPLSLPSFTPSTAPRAAPQAAPRAKAPAARPFAAPSPAVRQAGVPVATGSPAPAPAVAESPGFTLPGIAPTTPAPSAAPAVLPSVAPTPAVQAGAAWWWPYLAGAATLLAVLFGLLWWRRRREGEVLALTFEPPLTRRAAEPDLPDAPNDSPPQLARDIPEPALASGTAMPASHLPDLSLALDARRMSASLMATTLNYRLVVTNNGTEALSGLAIEGDMISAHASLPPEQQVAQAGRRLEHRHAAISLAPGESAEFNGDFRLPLPAITPIRSGEATYFVPLTRFRVEAANSRGTPVVLAQTFVVGELPESDSAALRPFRLDLGPRVFGRVGQRLVN